MLGTCKGHCEYRIFGHADYHKEYHIFFKYNYGSMGLLDHLFGTTAPHSETKGNVHRDKKKERKKSADKERMNLSLCVTTIHNR